MQSTGCHAFHSTQPTRHCLQHRALNIYVRALCFHTHLRALHIASTLHQLYINSTSTCIPNCRIHPPPNVCHVTRSPTLRRQTAQLCVRTEPSTCHELPTNCIMSLLAICSSRYHQLDCTQLIARLSNDSLGQPRFVCGKRTEERGQRTEASYIPPTQTSDTFHPHKHLLHSTNTNISTVNISTVPTCSSKYEHELQCCNVT